MTLPLKEMVALVTGAAGGIGAATALRLARDGADIVLNHFQTPQAAETLAAEIKALSRRVLIQDADVGSEAQVLAMFQAIDAHFGRLDILVSNAGITHAKDIFETSLDDWDRVIRTNLTGGFLTARAAMERMRRQGSGNIVLMGSIVGHQGALKGHVAYGASKGGLHTMAKTLARTGASLGIRVNAVAPGIVETDLLQSTHGRAGVKELKTRVPLDTLASVGDVANAVAWLVGPDSRHVTGAVLDINGGLLMR